MATREFLIYLLIFALLLQIGCSGIAQIPYPIDESKNDSEIRSLNYFGERLTSTIYLTNLVKVEAYWLKLKGDKIYFLTEGLDDTTSVIIDKIKSVRFYDMYGGCMKGGWLGVGLSLLGAILISDFGPKGGHPDGTAYAIVALGAGAMLLSAFYGIFFLGEREFDFVPNNSQ